MTISDTLGYHLVFRFFFFLPHYDVICGLLLNNFHHLSPDPPPRVRAPKAGRFAGHSFNQLKLLPPKKRNFCIEINILQTRILSWAET